MSKDHRDFTHKRHILSHRKVTDHFAMTRRHFGLGRVGVYHGCHVYRTAWCSECGRQSFVAVNLAFPSPARFNVH